MARKISEPRFKHPKATPAARRRSSAQDYPMGLDQTSLVDSAREEAVDLALSLRCWIAETLLDFPDGQGVAFIKEYKREWSAVTPGSPLAIELLDQILDEKIWKTEKQADAFIAGCHELNEVMAREAVLLAQIQANADTAIGEYLRNLPPDEPVPQPQM